MNAREECKRWVNCFGVDEYTKGEAILMMGDDEKLQSAFGTTLTFGTGGLRGIMGAGTNRMNLYTVEQATRGIGNYIVSLGEDAMRRGVVIAHDSRNNGVKFAEAAALALCFLGIKTYVFDELRPTPELSFAVREQKAIMGINITASHNPKEYNGYKVYFEDGAQIAGELATKLQQLIAAVDPLSVELADKEQAVKSGLYEVVGKDFDEKYLSAVLAEQMDMSGIGDEAKKLKAVYTPFHGAGYRLVPEMMKRLGIHVYPVPEQMIPNGDFPTLRSPNPEEKDGFELGVKRAKEVGAEFVIATDPDADRVAVGCLNSAGEVSLLTGNEVGALLTDFIITRAKETGTLPPSPAVISTIVSTRMTQKICEQNGVDYIECLTGFKYIGENIKKFEATGSHQFLFGFEESYGYLKGSYARDKDSVVSAMLIMQMAMYYKDKNMTLPQALKALYEKYGHFDEKTVSVTIGGADPAANMARIMKDIRENLPKEVSGRKVVKVGDFLTGNYTTDKGEKIPTGLPSSDVLHFTMDDGTVVVVRPSGTEPKVKLYVLASGESHNKCTKKIDFYVRAFRELLK